MKGKYKQQMARGDGYRKGSKRKREHVLGPHHLEERQMEEGVGLNRGMISLKIVQYN